MRLQPGMVIITQGNPRSLISNLIKRATGSWWTHCFIIVSETESIEAWFPRTRRFNTQERLDLLKREKRDHVVMDLPGITDEDRVKVVEKAETYIGTLYNVWNALFFLIFKTWVEKGRRVFCSQLIATSYLKALRRNLFSNIEENIPESLKDRVSNLHDGYCTPVELYRYSDLKECERCRV